MTTIVNNLGLLSKTSKNQRFFAMSEEIIENNSMHFINANLSSSSMMLEANHHMMQRFQQALKDHLIRQKEKLAAEIIELSSDLKRTEKEENDAATQLFYLKHDMNLQEKKLNERRNKLDGIMVKRVTLDSVLKESLERVKEKQIKFNEEQETEQNMRIHMEKLCSIEKKAIEWKQEVEGDLAVNFRVSEKTEADKKQAMEEKRRLDIYMFRLMAEINKLESELNLLNTQLDQKEKEKDLLNQTVADANADLQALSADQKRLLGDWNSIIVCMSQKDSSYGEVLKERHNAEEAFRNLSTEIESYKRSAIDEMRRNEELGFIMRRAKHDLERSSRQLKELLQRKMNLQRHVADTADLAIQAEKDLHLSEVQKLAKESELENVQKRLDEFNRNRHELEDECLNLLLEQSTNDKVALQLNRCIKNLRGKAREEEIVQMELENRIAKLITQTEDTKMEMTRNQEILNEINRDLDSKESELGLVEADTKDIYNQITNKQGKLLSLTRKMEELALNAGWDEVGRSPLEIRIQDLEWKIQDLRKENEELQIQWMRQQSSNVKLTNQRSEQLQEVSLFRKQIILLQQKLLKTNNDVEEEEGYEMEIQKNISHLQHKLTNLSVSLATKSGHKEHTDKNLLVEQKDFVKSLKDSENEQMLIKREIEDLEGLLEERAEIMIETQRDMLAWDRKLILATETKQAIQKEKSEQGDIGQMKLEIHRMEVRYSQLKKFQDKLVNDLDQTIRRREAIIDEADAREKRERGTNKSRANFQRKLDELRNRLKKVRLEEKMIDKLIAEEESNQEHMLNQMNEKTEQVKKLQEEVKGLENQQQDGQLRYQQGVDILVRRQRKCKLFGQLKLGKYRPLYRNELALDNELRVAKTINGDLTAILDALVTDFPSHKVDFLRILNTLKPDDI